MHTPSRLQRAADVPSLARVRAWRTHADILRDSVEAPALTTGQRTALRNEERVIECLAIMMRLCIAQIPLASARRGNSLPSCEAVLPPRRTIPP